MYLDPFTAIILVLIGIVVCTIFTLMIFIIAVFVNSKFTSDDSTESKIAQSCDECTKCSDSCPIYKTFSSSKNKSR